MGFKEKIFYPFKALFCINICALSAARIFLILFIVIFLRIFGHSGIYGCVKVGTGSPRLSAA